MGIGRHQPAQQIDLRHVVIAGDREHGRLERVDECTRDLELVLGAVLREVAADHHEIEILRVEFGRQRRREVLVVLAEMQVRQMRHAHGQATSAAGCGVGSAAGRAGASTFRLLGRTAKVSGVSSISTSPSIDTDNSGFLLTTVSCWTFSYSMT